MREYESLYRTLGLPDSLIGCALGQIQIPIVGWTSPADWYGFPPALVPIASYGSGPSYLGLWKHWFCNREPTFVKMYVGSGRRVVEVARTPSQFFCYVAITAITIEEGVAPALQRFADQVGIVNLNEIDALSLKTGDNPQGFSALPQFASDLPLSSVKEVEQYTGTFPTGRFTSSYRWWGDACSFEVSDEAIMAWPKDVALPPWMRPSPKLPVFNELLQRGNLLGAWLTLNSSGWSIMDAKDALLRLARSSGEPAFEQLARSWASVADPSPGSY